MNCKRCGTLLREDAVYCHECGQGKDKPLLCTFCGEELYENEKFCHNCGRGITKQAYSTGNNGYYSSPSYQEPRSFYQEQAPTYQAPEQNYQNTSYNSSTSNYQDTNPNYDEYEEDEYGYLDSYSFAKDVLVKGIIAAVLFFVPVFPIVFGIKNIKRYNAFKNKYPNIQGSDKTKSIIGLILSISAIVTGVGALIAEIYLLVWFIFIRSTVSLAYDAYTFDMAKYYN